MKVAAEPMAATVVFEHSLSDPHFSTKSSKNSDFIFCHTQFRKVRSPLPGRISAPLRSGTLAPENSMFSTTMLSPATTQMPLPCAYFPAASMRARPLTPRIVRLFL